MKGLTQLEVDILKDAANPDNSEGVCSREVVEVIMRLLQRRLISMRHSYRAASWDPNVTLEVIEGVITPLGRLVLSIALTEPSLVRAS